VRVGIDATCWSNQRGYGRYARGLLNALLSDSSDPHQYIFFVDDQTQSKWTLPERAEVVTVMTSEAPTKAATSESRRSMRDLWAMTSAVSGKDLDAFFFPSVYTYFPIIGQANVILGIHDVIPELFPKLVFPERKQRTLWQSKGWLARRQANYILTVSEYAKASIIRQFNWDPDRVWVVGEAPDPVFQPISDENLLKQTLERHGLKQDSRYIICLGGLNPHKNLGTLFEILSKLHQEPEYRDVQLVLVGPAEDDSFTPGVTQARQAVDTLGIRDIVHFTGFIPDNDVVCLLNAAQALVMPSLEEGFGLGAVEAAACGTPVVATRNSPLPQILDGGGLFIDPEKPEELLNALVEILCDKSRGKQMGINALAKARELSWDRSAGQFRELLANIEGTHE